MEEGTTGEPEMSDTQSLEGWDFFSTPTYRVLNLHKVSLYVFILRRWGN